MSCEYMRYMNRWLSVHNWRWGLNLEAESARCLVCKKPFISITEVGSDVDYNLCEEHKNIESLAKEIIRLKGVINDGTR